MGIRLGDTCPDFSAETTEGTIQFHEWLGEDWGILFSHPKDFTPVCTTELGYMAKIKPEFDKRKVKVIALSVDSIADHRVWIQDINETQNTRVNYPIIADQDRRIAQLFDMIDQDSANNLTVRSVFVIGPDKKIKLTLTYPASTGRNFDELLRVIESLRLTATEQLATPVNWQMGDDCVVVPSVSDEEADRKYRDVKRIKPYLRMVAVPKKEPVST